MAIIKVERLCELTPERKTAIMSRSMEDIGDIYESVRDICKDIRQRGDQVTLEHYKKLKEDISPADLKVTAQETAAAYEAVGAEVVEHLKFAARNIEKFHTAQLEREMWSVEIAPGILAGGVNRPLESAGAISPGRQANYPPAS